jgi:arylsulfatase A-like enzyme
MYVRVPGLTAPGAVSSSLSSHVDLASTICALARVQPDPGMRGVDQTPVFADPRSSARDYVLFAHDTAHTSRVANTRYAIRGVFDGRHKYARYYGVGGGLPNDDFSKHRPPKLYDVDADFDDHDHELYDLHEDPHELVNLAMDRGRRTELRKRFDDLLAIEGTDFS